MRFLFFFANSGDPDEKGYISTWSAMFASSLSVLQSMHARILKVLSEEGGSSFVVFIFF